MLALPERTQLPLALNQTLQEAVRAHREARAADGSLAPPAESGLTAEARLEAESAGLMFAMRTPLPAELRRAALALPSASESLSAPMDGNAFAVLLGALLREAGARSRMALGCAHEEAGKGAAVGVGPAAEAAAATAAANAEAQTGAVLLPGECALWCEARIGRGQARLQQWAQRIYGGSREARTLHFRTDKEGFTWLNLDWHDAAKTQAPGAPYRKYSTAASFYLDTGSHGRWEADGKEFVAPIGSLTIAAVAAGAGGY